MSATASGDDTSNSIQACGTGRSAGHSGVPKVACAAWVSGQRANAFRSVQVEGVEVPGFVLLQRNAQSLGPEGVSGFGVGADGAEPCDELEVHIAS